MKRKVQSAAATLGKLGGKAKWRRVPKHSRSHIMRRVRRGIKEAHSAA